MKACLKCGAGMADAADRCTECGMAVGAEIAGVVKEHDEAVGYERSPMVQGIILALLALLITVAVFWLCE